MRSRCVSGTRRLNHFLRLCSQDQECPHLYPTWGAVSLSDEPTGDDSYWSADQLTFVSWSYFLHDLMAPFPRPFLPIAKGFLPGPFDPCAFCHVGGVRHARRRLTNGSFRSLSIPARVSKSYGSSTSSTVSSKGVFLSVSSTQGGPTHFRPGASTRGDGVQRA